MRKDNEFCDITLACNDDSTIEAHKVILAASSIFFSDILKLNKHSHPLFYIRGVNTSQLRAVLDFIYHGEVSIYQEDLDNFLALAEDLKLKGLNISQADEQDQAHVERSFPKHDTLKDKTSPCAQEKLKLNVCMKSEPCYETANINKFDMNTQEAAIAVLVEQSERTSTTSENLDETISSMMENLGQGRYSCNVCGKMVDNGKKSNMITHIEGKHIKGVSHPCSHCGHALR